MNKLAGPWFRFAGWAVDFLLWLALWLGAVWWMLKANTLAALMDNLVIVISLGAAGVLVNLLMTAGFTHWFGGTIGKLAFGIEVVGQDGKRLTFWRAVWREWFGKMVAGMAWWLGFIWILIDKDRRGWHDMMAGSKVVVRRNFLAVGLLTLAILLAVNAALVNSIWDKAKSNSRLYQEIINGASI